MKLEKKSIKQLKKQLDTIFSEYIRRRDKGKCISCGIVKPWKEQQNGHYISRSHQNTRYSDKNCNCQCVGCNVFKYGNMPSYTIELEKKYGYGIVQELKKEGDILKQWKPKELIDMIEVYKKKISKLKDRD
jgi:hypothetical protein